MANLILSPIGCFDALQDSPSVGFSWDGSNIISNTLYIFNTALGYDEQNAIYVRKQDGRVKQHQVIRSRNECHSSMKGKFVNSAIQYAAKIKIEYNIFNSDVNGVAESELVYFYCNAKAQCEFEGFGEKYVGKVAVVRENSVNISVSFHQPEGEALTSYNFELYNSLNERVYATGTKYVSASTITVSCDLGGLDDTEIRSGTTELDYSKPYIIKFSGETSRHRFYTISQAFVVSAVNGGVGSTVILKNDPSSGVISISSGLKIINAEWIDHDQSDYGQNYAPYCENKEAFYWEDEDGEHYEYENLPPDVPQEIVDHLKDIIPVQGIWLMDSVLHYSDGFTLIDPWFITLRGTFQPGDIAILREKDGDGNILQFGTISLCEYKYSDNPLYYYRFLIERGAASYEIRSDYFSDYNYMTYVELAHKNKFYNLTALQSTRVQPFTGIDGTYVSALDRGMLDHFILG